MVEEHINQPAKDVEVDELEEKKIALLDEEDIALLKTYGLGPYSNSIKTLESDLRSITKKCQRLVRCQRV